MKKNNKNQEDNMRETRKLVKDLVGELDAKGLIATLVFLQHYLS